MEAARYSERAQQLEREKLDSVVAERKKLEALEISKINEIEKLQAVHRLLLDTIRILHKLGYFAGPVLVIYIENMN